MDKISKSKSMILPLFFVFLITLGKPVFSQDIAANKSQENIKIDGRLNEAAWEKAMLLKDFYQFEPKYGEKASFPTKVKVIYDNHSIYFGFECEDPEPELITAKITKRDGGLDKDDGIVIMLDTFLDKNNCYLFSVNPLGTQMDGKIADNGRTNDFNWDETWYSECLIHKNGWTAEIEIPFKSLKYDNKQSSWGFNAARRIARKLEKSFSVRNITTPNRISQFGKITNLDFSDISAKRYTIIPYLQSQFQKGEKASADAGVDLRYDLTTKLSVEATVNPDFATIEADVEKVNLTRYEMRYPEKRPFFLEGAENYSTRIRQFYSRRIGEIPWGAKVSGKLGKWKVNGLVTQSDPATAAADVEAGKKAVFSVFRVNREFKNGSNIGIIGTNRMYQEENSGSLGLTATLFFTDVLGMTSQLIKTHGTEDHGSWTGFIRPSYDSQFSHFHFRYSHYGEGVRENLNSTGFIRDDDKKEFDTNIRHTFWINRYGLESLRPSFNYNRYWSQEGMLRSYNSHYSIQARFLKKWDYSLSYVDEFKAEYDPFFEKDFNNHLLTNKLEFDNKKGMSLSFVYIIGHNYDRDLEKVSGGIDLKILDGWNLSYHFDKHWFSPAEPDDNSWIHYIRTTYYINKDLYFKLFYQSKYRFLREWTNPKFELLRNTIQIVFVWRFLPPFGSLQLAYQEGSTRYTDEEGQGRTLFAKLSWVF